MFKYVEADKEFRVNYVFTESPSILTDNKGQVIKIAQDSRFKIQDSRYFFPTKTAVGTTTAISFMPHTIIRCGRPYKHLYIH